MRRTTTTLTRLTGSTYYYARSPIVSKSKSKPNPNPITRGQNLNAARELVPETSASPGSSTATKLESSSLLDVSCPGLPGCGTEVVVSRTTLRRSSDQEERMQTVKEMDLRAKVAELDTFVDGRGGDSGRLKLTGSWSRAGMLTEEYETVNRTEEPYGRKEGVEDDLRYGCMEKYRRDSQLVARSSRA